MMEKNNIIGIETFLRNAIPSLKFFFIFILIYGKIACEIGEKTIVRTYGILYIAE